MITDNDAMVALAAERRDEMERTGGPAFPMPDACPDIQQGGMSLRDWFAGQALSGAIATLSTEYACRTLSEEIHEDESSEGRVDLALAKGAYQYADAMIAQRKKVT